MTQHEHSTVVGLFHDSGRAREAIEALKDMGFPAQDIGIVMKDRDEAKDMAHETGTHAGEGAATGAIGGGILGGLAGWLVGMGALAIPGVGPFIAAGAFGAALTGAGIGAGVGAVAGALVGMGVPKEEADWYEGEVKTGRTLVTVDAHGRYSEAYDTLRRFGAYDIHDRGTESGTMTSDRTDTGMGTLDTNQSHSRSEQGFSSESMTGDRRTVELREEQLHARKEREKVGEVGISKEVVTEHRSIDVPVTREEVYIERRPVDRPSNTPVGGDESFSVPVHEETVHTDKETVVREEVDIGKRQTTGTERVSDTVRHEELRVTGEGDFDVKGGEGFRAHDHKWVGEKCEICGATRQRRAA